MIHLNSTTFSQIPLELPSQSSNLINDIETDKHSVNQNLCESFEAMMKKDQIDCSTRNTQWSHNENTNCGAVKEDNHSQNQNKQKTIHFTTVWKFHDEKNSEIIKSYQSQLQTQKINSLKKIIIEKRNQKTKKLRSLLPYYYSIQLPTEIKDMLKKIELIDKYLFEKKSAEYIDNVHNILRSLFKQEEMSSIWSTVKKIIFLSEDYYKVRVDPLKNLCLGFASKRDNKLAKRKERLRKVVVDYFCKNKDSFGLDDIPEAFIEPLKTARFYPQNLSIQPKTLQKKLKPEYIEQIKLNVRTSEAIISHKNASSTSTCPTSHEALPSLDELQKFCDSISKIYRQRQVGHMYKTSLIENLRKHSTFNLERIFLLLKYIQQEQLFLEVLVKSGCHIFRIVEKEKKSLLEILEMKTKNVKI